MASGLKDHTLRDLLADFEPPSRGSKRKLLPEVSSRHDTLNPKP